ncbi:suppressor of fused domain protein [Mycolicibacter arupensis]|uniref:Suppressor of fused domain protein n=1 Tax=Mycolicibacter arupensis TaxID=342002 RepID=A0A0F5MXP4_9MYCO|nr:Suppressor of fused protein (SUFU) [Mycolicibacter arupensis]MCV7275049.1 suppressor of fused domain protein [Mycolicibacter arupensis]OQZ95026.1 Suppressor of fused protein (SUFU) [Mycolicibacter arupensis]TXI58117.1 MAG: suppressor of fused domain protein [Mycolicibacter arupensis]
MSADLGRVREHVSEHFAAAGLTAGPDTARVTFLGVEPIDVLRFGPGPDRMVHYVSAGCSRHPMGDPGQLVADPVLGPRAEIVVRLRSSGSDTGLARSLAAVAAAPVVEGVVLAPDALIDLGGPLWTGPSGPVPFTAVLLGESDIAELALAPPREPVRFLAAVPITATEAAWVRLKGAEALREAWRSDGVDVHDPQRRASAPH